MHQESFGLLYNTECGYLAEIAKVPSPLIAADARPRGGLNPTVSTVDDLLTGFSRQTSTRALPVGFQLRRNLNDLGTTNCFSSH